MLTVLCGCPLLTVPPVLSHLFCPTCSVPSFLSPVHLSPQYDPCCHVLAPRPFCPVLAYLPEWPAMPILSSVIADVMFQIFCPDPGFMPQHFCRQFFAPDVLSLLSCSHCSALSALSYMPCPRWLVSKILHVNAVVKQLHYDCTAVQLSTGKLGFQLGG